MRNDAITLEEGRLGGLNDISEYAWVYERHRVFPAIFENRCHKKIIDLSAGVGCVAQRIRDNYQAELVCNDISPTCLNVLRKLGLATCSFDLDHYETPFPFDDGSFDAAISLATIEHLTYPDHFLSETHRILAHGGSLYISTPNYASLYSVLKILLSGIVHDPLSKETLERYEFYAHVKYFTFKTLLDFVTSFGYTPETVYLTLPLSGSRYQSLRTRSPFKAYTHRYGRWLMYHILPPRWIAEPILCFRKCHDNSSRKLRKVVL
jgi:SAM-dependent methyltransferase